MKYSHCIPCSWYIKFRKACLSKVMSLYDNAFNMVNAMWKNSAEALFKYSVKTTAIFWHNSRVSVVVLRHRFNL